MPFPGLLVSSLPLPFQYGYCFYLFILYPLAFLLSLALTTLPCPHPPALAYPFHVPTNWSKKGKSFEYLGCGKLHVQSGPEGPQTRSGSGYHLVVSQSSWQRRVNEG
ncbi:hypothetical protein LY78DRAFT_162402 [Colletotrichum sublineola]|nr:hypothetical protein LY78DRAFT_162402 [Colletotrichum sublineola]